MRIAFAGLAIATLSCSLALAQNVAQPGTTGQRVPGGQTIQPGQPGQPGQIRVQGQPGQPGQQTQASTSDQEIAAKIYGCCHNEVELAKFAQSRLQSKEAKQFAEMMIKDHTPDCDTYSKFAGNLVSHGQQAGGQQGSHANWVSIHKEMAQQCLQSTQKELGQKQGAEFDQCYITQQAMAHHAMKDALTVLKKHASPQLAQQIDKSLEGVTAHLEHAKEIVKKLEDHPSERVSRRPEGSK